jgi:hypothetical protein
VTVFWSLAAGAWPLASGPSLFFVFEILLNSLNKIINFLLKISKRLCRFSHNSLFLREVVNPKNLKRQSMTSDYQPVASSLRLEA